MQRANMWDRSSSAVLIRPSLFYLGLAACVAFCAACGSAATSVVGPSDSRCGVTLSLDPPTIGGGGGTGTLTIATARECPWEITTSGDWLRVTGPERGQ